MHVEVSILGRKSADEAYAVLGMQVIEFTGDMLSVSLAKPDQEDQKYLRVCVASAETIKFVVCGPLRRGYVVDNGSRDAPYSNTILLARIGVPMQVSNGIGQAHEPSSDSVSAPIE